MFRSIPKWVASKEIGNTVCDQQKSDLGLNSSLDHVEERRKHLLRKFKRGFKDGRNLLDEHGQVVPTLNRGAKSQVEHLRLSSGANIPIGKRRNRRRVDLEEGSVSLGAAAEEDRHDELVESRKAPKVMCRVKRLHTDEVLVAATLRLVAACLQLGRSVDLQECKRFWVGYGLVFCIAVKRRYMGGKGSRVERERRR